PREVHAPSRRIRRRARSDARRAHRAPRDRALGSLMAFHPGHDALHGFTVVIFSDGPSTWVGRWQEERDGMIHLVDACVHSDGDRGLTKAAFLAELAKTGPRPTHRMLAVPRSDVSGVRQLGDVIREARGER